MIKIERLSVTSAMHEVAQYLGSAALVASMNERNVASTTELLKTAADAEFEDLPAVARTMFSGISGSTRIVFERGATVPDLEKLRRELSLMCRSYLQAAARRTRPAA